MCSFTKCSKHGLLELNSKTCQLCETGEEGKKKGKIRTRKHLTSLTRTIGAFIREYYKPALESYAYHLPYVRILSKNGCGNDRRAAFKKILYSLLCGRDYAERLGSSMNNEVQHDHFGNDRDLSMEGSSVEMHAATLLELYEEGNITVDQLSTHLEFHSHFSDDSPQDAASTHVNMETLIKALKARTPSPIRKGTILFDNTDGCAKQYRCWVAVYLLTLLAVSQSIMIDRAIKAPGHGKDIVDGLNATDKSYLKESMIHTKASPDDKREKRMSPQSMSEDEKMSFAHECLRLCSHPDRLTGVKGQTKHAKREAAAKLLCRCYYTMSMDDVLFSSLCMGVAKNPSLEGTHNGIRGRYNIRADPDLGLGRAALRRVPCACDSCITQMQEPWETGIVPCDQPRYKQNRMCRLFPIFDGLNDWVIVDLVKTKRTDNDQVEAAQDVVLDSIARDHQVNISADNIGAFHTDDPDTEGYYLVRWIGEPYNIEQDTELTDFDPPMILQSGELVCDAIYFNTVPRANHWYTPSTNRTKVRLQQVLLADATLEVESQTNPLPNSCRKIEARRQGAKKLLQSDHDTIIMDAISRRQIIDHDEEMLFNEEGSDLEGSDLEVESSDGEPSADEEAE